MKQHLLNAILLISAMAISSLAFAVDQTAQMPNMLIEIESPMGFDDTLEQIEINAKSEGWKVPSKWKVDFQKNFLRVTGVDIGPNQVIKMCEPFAAAELMVKDEYKQLAAMMPCTIAVYVKSNGKTYVSMLNLEMVGQMFGGDVAKMAKELAPQMASMLTLD